MSLDGLGPFFLIEIGEPRYNDLRIVIAEGQHGEPVQSQFGEVTPIAPDHRSRYFEVYWAYYVAYAVRNESFYRREEGLTLNGQALQSHEASAFLRYVSETSFASNDHPGPLTHWSLWTEWHIFDVVGPNAPEIRELTNPDGTPH